MNITLIFNAHVNVTSEDGMEDRSKNKAQMYNVLYNVDQSENELVHV